MLAGGYLFVEGEEPCLPADDLPDNHIVAAENLQIPPLAAGAAQIICHSVEDTPTVPAFDDTGNNYELKLRLFHKGFIDSCGIALFDIAGDDAGKLSHLDYNLFDFGQSFAIYNSFDSTNK